MRKFLLFVALAATIVSCQQQEDANISMEKSDEIARTFKFVTLKDQLTSNAVGTRAETGKNDFTKIDITTESPLIICSWDDWGRTSRNCRGFGLCHFEWFPSSESEIKNGNFEGTAAILKRDSLGNPYIDLFLAEPIPTIADDLPQLSIDKDLLGERVQYYTADSTSRSTTTPSANINSQRLDKTNINDLIMQQGQYRYISELGTYGGYRVYLTQQ